MKKLTLYGAKWCAYCNQLKRQFDDEKLEYEYLDVDDRANEATMLNATEGRFLIPTVVVGDKEKVMQNPTIQMVEEAINE